MHKLQPIVDTVLKTRRSKEERSKNKNVADQRMIQQYIKDGSKGDLDLTETHITSLPNNLTTVGGTLNLGGVPITSFPNNLKNVDGDLNVKGSRITSLPDNLNVGGALYVAHTPMKSLPMGLTIGWSLDVTGSGITLLPIDLKKIKGTLTAFHSKLETLPDGFIVEKDVHLRYSPLKSLPSDLVVNRDLDVRNVKIYRNHTVAQLHEMFPGVKGEIHA
jgi:hypothetical protein